MYDKAVDTDWLVNKYEQNALKNWCRPWWYRLWYYDIL